jgi:hypothetical protein
MAWEWSHTSEAYDNARENIARLSRLALLEIVREWAHYDRNAAGTIRRRDTRALSRSTRRSGLGASERSSHVYRWRICGVRLSVRLSSCVIRQGGRDR